MMTSTAIKVHNDEYSRMYKASRGSTLLHCLIKHSVMGYKNYILKF